MDRLLTWTHEAKHLPNCTKNFQVQQRTGCEVARKQTLKFLKLA